MKEQRGATEQVDAPLLIHPGKNHLDSLTLTKTVLLPAPRIYH